MSGKQKKIAKLERVQKYNFDDLYAENENTVYVSQPVSRVPYATAEQ